MAAIPPRIPPVKAPPALITGGQTVGRTPLTPDEEAIFERDFERVVKLIALERDIGELIAMDIEHYKIVAEAAKAALNNLPFQGLQATGPNIFGMQPIRAITVRNPGIASGATPVIVWTRSVTSTGWQDVFGSSANPVSLAQTGAAPNSATNLKDRVVLAFSGLLETSDSPKFSEFRVHLQNVDYGVMPATWIEASNVFYAPLMGVFYVGKNGQFWIRGNARSTGTSVLQLVGLCFATGDYMTLET